LADNTSITTAIAQKYSKANFVWQSELAYKQQQLAELYGPALVILQGYNDVFDIWKGGKMGQVHKAAIKLISDESKALRGLLINKAHLIEGAAVPPGCGEFFTSSVLFDLYVASDDGGMVAGELQDKVKSPDVLTDHIVSTVKELKAQIANLRSQYKPIVTDSSTGDFRSSNNYIKDVMSPYPGI
jgi:hypothetical protein